MHWQGLDEVPAALRRPPPVLDTAPLAPVAPPPTVATDGSHAVLVDNGSHWIVAVRSAAAGAVQDVQGRIHATDPDGAAAAVDAAYTQRGLRAPSVRGAEAFAEAMRALMEMDATMEAMRRLPEGGLVLVDGALTGMPPHAQDIADRLLDRATASGLHIAGISKRSSLQVDGVGLSAIDVPGRWSAAVAGTRIARLHPDGPVFRIDAEAAALGWLAHWSDDAVYTGYPYPLAKAHNLAAITHSEARRLRQRVVAAAGGDARRLDDFHTVLDRNVPR